MGMFVIWFVRRSVEIWRSAPPFGAREIDWSLARAATIVIALLVAHSLVEFPLRTGAMMAIMAFACALLIEPPVGAEDALEPQALRTRTRHLGARRPEPAPSLALSRRQSAPTSSVRALGSSVALRSVNDGARTSNGPRSGASHQSQARRIRAVNHQSLLSLDLRSGKAKLLVISAIRRATRRTAMIDLHCHILPGIDDGAPDLSVSIEMARAFVADGVSVVACTPHILPGLYHNSGRTDPAGDGTAAANPE